MSRLLCAFVCAFIVAATLTPPAASAAHPRYYLALGDSLAFGYVNDQTPLDPQCMSAKSVGYVCIVHRYLAKRFRGDRLANLSIPGADSCVFIHGKGSGSPCAGAAVPVPLVPSELAMALVFLQTNRGAVRLITINVGGDDLLPLLTSGINNPAATSAQLPKVLKLYKSRLSTILSRLRQAAPHTPIILVNQYNPLGGLGSPPLPAGVPAAAAAAIAQLNRIMKAEAAHHHVSLTDVSSRFDAHPGGAATLTEVPETLTTGHLNIHPTPQGYRVMARAVLKTYKSTTRS